jgi:exportin-2 (importin alpha re-exporter)
VGENIIPVTQIVITKLTGALGRVASNPRNPQFNHYLFESVAVLVRSVGSKDPSSTSMLEPLLFEPFTFILQMDIAEFTPYVFQVLAQLLEYRPPEAGISAAYMSLFAPLLTPMMWEKKGNIPALVRLLQAYISKDGPSLITHLNQILGVFQKLLAAKSTEISAFELLSSTIIHFPQEAMEPLLSTLFALLFTRLQASKTPRYTQLVTTFFALFVGKYGAQVLFDRTQAIQAGMGAMLLLHVWSPRIRSDPPVHRIETKVQVVGMTKLLCECPPLLGDVNGQAAWTHTLGSLVILLTSSAFRRTSTTDGGEEPETEIETVYDAQFSRLVQATKAVEDPFPEVGDARSFFSVSLHNALASNGGLLRPLIQQGLSADPKLSLGLEQMFHQAGLQLG